MTNGRLAIEANQVFKAFRVKASGKIIQALGGITLHAPAGQLTALIGPDGAGKTTFLRLVAGLLPIERGSLTVLGINVDQAPQAVQNRISYMSQRFGLYEDLSVQENLDLYADLHGVPHEVRRERYNRLLEMTDLSSFTARLSGKLSGGMKQKLGLACTLVRSPDLLLLDEPTVGVDPLSRRELWMIVQKLIEEEQLSVLMTTAYMDEAERCSQVYVLHEGKILAHGKPSDITRHAQGLCFSAKTEALESTRQLQVHLQQHTGIIDTVPEGNTVRFIKHPDYHQPVTGLNPSAIQSIAPRVEDGFMVLLHTRQQAAAALSHTPPTPAAHASLSTEQKQPIIEVRELVRTFGQFTAVDNTTFSVYRGEVFGLLGPNGAGKTTTFRMLCGLLPASSGFAQVDGMDMRTARAEARRHIGYVSQKFSLYGSLSILENLEFFGGAYGLYGKALRQRIGEIVKQFDLQGLESTPAGELPGGIKQRLAMAVGLLHQPAILFLDEPTSGADPLTRRNFWRRITSLASSGTTIIITTHFMEEAEYCDRIMIQDAGKMLALGTPEQVRHLAGETPDQHLTMDQAFINIVEKGRAGRNKASGETA